MARNILVVEDDRNISDLIRMYLEKEGFEVRSAYDGGKAIEEYDKQAPDMVLLDIMLPGMDGFSLCETIRHGDPYIGIIMASAKGQESDKIRGLSIGADDYITKPFDPVEVLARVRSQLRRYTQLGAKKEEEKPNVYTVGPVVLDEEKKSVTVDGDEVALTPIEFNILRLLMKNPGRIYSSAQIYELVWKEDSLGAETSVSVHIRHLRQKLEINPSEPRYLKVVWGLGYKMEDKK